MKQKWFRKTLAIALSVAMMCTPMMVAASVQSEGNGEGPNSEMMIEDTPVGEQQSVEQEVLDAGEKSLRTFAEEKENPISKENDNLEQILPERNSVKALGHLSMIFDAKWQNFCVRKSTYANAGMSTRFFTVSPAAMISLP